MLISKAAAVALLPASGAAAAVMPASSLPQNRIATDISCQTSNASPTNEKVTNAINEISGKPGSCVNSNDAGSHCTTCVNADGGKIGVCGELDDELSALSYHEVADMASQVQQICQTDTSLDGKVGGTCTVNQWKRVIVF